MYGLHERIRKSLESGLFLLNINIQYDTMNSMKGCENYGLFRGTKKGNYEIHKK